MICDEYAHCEDDLDCYKYAVAVNWVKMKSPPCDSKDQTDSSDEEKNNVKSSHVDSSSNLLRNYAISYCSVIGLLSLGCREVLNSCEELFKVPAILDFSVFTIDKPYAKTDKRNTYSEPYEN